jgi:hypothetical protein
MGYRLQDESYQTITERRSEVLGLRLEIDGQRLSFYREDNGDKLLISTELESALLQERQRAEQESQRAEQEYQRAERLAAKLRELGVELVDDI